MTNDNLITLPKDVADAIDRLKGEEFNWTVELMDSANFINVDGYVAVSSGEPSYPIAAYIAEDYDNNLPRYMTGLVNGYEVEQAPEEAVREYYLAMESCIKSSGSDVGFYEGSADAIVLTLNLLGVKIPGVND